MQPRSGLYEQILGLAFPSTTNRDINAHSSWGKNFSILLAMSSTLGLEMHFKQHVYSSYAKKRDFENVFTTIFSNIVSVAHTRKYMLRKPEMLLKIVCVLVAYLYRPRLGTSYQILDEEIQLKSRSYIQHTL